MIQYVFGALTVIHIQSTIFKDNPNSLGKVYVPYFNEVWEQNVFDRYVKKANLYESVELRLSKLLQEGFNHA
jgi:hypothetical protein